MSIKTNCKMSVNIGTTPVHRRCTQRRSSIHGQNAAPLSLFRGSSHLKCPTNVHNYMLLKKSRVRTCLMVSLGAASVNFSGLLKCSESVTSYGDRGQKCGEINRLLHRGTRHLMLTWLVQLSADTHPCVSCPHEYL